MRPVERLAIDIFFQQPFAHHQAEIFARATPWRIRSLIDDVAQIIQTSPGLVVVDEAYYAFASDSFISSLARYPNLLVMRTFSKLGMAGLRLGFLAGSAALLGQLEKLRSGRKNVTISCTEDDTASSFCMNKAAILSALARLTPWNIASDPNGFRVWLGTPGRTVTEVRFHSQRPSHVWVDRRFPAPF